MKVLMGYIFCTKGGVETAIYNRLRNICSTDISVDLLFFNDYGGSKLFDDFEGKVFFYSERRDIISLINKEDYDIVISIDTPELIEILKLMNYKGKIGLEIHTTYLSALGYLKSDIMNEVDFIIVPSVCQKEFITSQVKVKKEIYVLGNAISDKIEYVQKKIEDYEKRIILWVGRLDSHKNWRLFLKIAKGLKERNEKYIYYVVGGLKSEKNEIESFEKKIYEYGLECDVRWIPQIDYKNMGSMYSDAVCSGGGYISTSTNESFGMTVIEAMYCHCPVIVTSVGALSELVNEERGLVINVDYRDEDIDRINDFIVNNDCKEICDTAFEYVKSNFSGESIGNKFFDIISKVMN